MPTSAAKRNGIISKSPFWRPVRKYLEERKTSRKEWISDDTWGRIAKRKEIKSKLLNAANETVRINLRRQYREANKSVKKKQRGKTKRTWVGNLAQAAQNAADLKNSRELYRITRQLAKNSFTNAASLVRGKYGNQLIAVEEQVQRWQEQVQRWQEQVQRWQEHFGEILSAPTQEHEHDLNTTQHPIVINGNPPKHAEIVKVLKQLKKESNRPRRYPTRNIHGISQHDGNIARTPNQNHMGIRMIPR